MRADCVDDHEYPLDAAGLPEYLSNSTLGIADGQDNGAAVREDEATAMLAKAIALLPSGPPRASSRRSHARSESGGLFRREGGHTRRRNPVGDIKRISEGEMKVSDDRRVSKLFTLLADLDDKSVQARLSSPAGSTAKWDA